jgi:hypothetical protein
MDQRLIVRYFNRKGLTAQVIQNNLVATLGQEAIVCSTVTNYLREVQTGADHANPLPEEISPDIDDSDEAILGALEELPFSSVRQLLCETHLPNSTVYRRLDEKLGFTAGHL